MSHQPPQESHLNVKEGAPAAASRGLTTLFFRNRHLLTLTVLVVLVAGASALLSLPRLEDPRITNRFMTVVTPMPGASPERVESQVSEVLEESLEEIDDIKHIESTSRAGVSVVKIELEDHVGPDTNDAIFSEIRDKIGDAVPRLPAAALGPVVDDKRDPIGFTLIVALRWGTGGGASLAVLDRLAGELADRFRQLDGTELVRVYGVPVEEITVTVDPAELAELGLTAPAIAQALERGDAKGPAGVLRGRRSDVLLEVEGELGTLERIAALPLPGARGAGSAVRLGDVAILERGLREPDSEIALVDGDRSLLVAVRMASDQRVDRWADTADRVLAGFEQTSGSGLVVEKVFEQERYTSDRLSELVGNLLAGAAVVLLVIFLVMGWRLAWIVGLALPLVVSAVFFAWQVSGNAMHQMSIFGLIIALGLLIDNAIVVADDVSRAKAAGATAVEAVDRTVRHLFFPLLASTLTTILAFAPILLLPGGPGDFVGSIGSSVILAISASFLLALTVTAALAGRFARPTPSGDQRRWWRDGIGSERAERRTTAALRWGLAHPLAAIALTLFLPLSGFVVARTLGNEFFPPTDRDMFHVQMWLADDVPIAHTAERALAVEAAIREMPETERVFWLLGRSFPTVYYNLVMSQDDAPHYAQGIVTAASAPEAKAMIDRLQARLDARFPDAQLVVRQFGQGPPVLADVELRLRGPNLATLQDLGETVRRVLQKHPDVLHTQATLPRGRPKLWLEADEDQTRLAGLALRDVADQLQSALEGIAGGTVIEQLEQMPVRVRTSDAHRGDLGAIASHPLVGSGPGDPNGPGWIPLPALGELRLTPEIGGISRYDGERTNILRGYTRNEALPIDVTNAVLATLESEGFELPAGYRLELGGALEQDAQAKGNLLTYAPVLLTLMVAVLILAFRSTRLAALLFVVAGLSVGLALLSTWTMGFPVSFNTILGTLGLIGVALNDSIVVLAAIRADPAARAGDREAILRAVMGTTRHVLATTLTTMGGFLPLLIFVGGDFWPSLAIVLVGGIAGASLLALGLIPAAYVLITGPPRSAATKNVAESPQLGRSVAAASLTGGAP